MSRSLLILSLIFISLRYFFLGDVSFLQDEAMLLQNAWLANASHSWVSVGLLGSKGTSYGPLATWIYQLLFMLTHNLTLVLVLKITFVSILQLWGVYELRGLFKKWPDFVFLLIFMSPYFWFYSRMYWDNPFNISFTLLLLTGVFRFVKTPSFGRLMRVALFAAFCISIHLMSSSLLLALAIWMLIYQGRYLIRNWGKVLVALVAMILVLWPYLNHLLHNPSSGTSFAWNLKFLEGALLGTRVLTGLGLNYIYGSEYSLIEFAFPYLHALLGIGVLTAFAVGLFAVVRPSIQRKFATGLDASADGLPVTRFLQLFFGIHLLFCFFTSLGGHPHYYNSSWVPFWMLSAYALASPKPWVKKWIQNFSKLYVSVSFASILSLLILAHQWSGIQNRHYGASLSNQIAIVDQMMAEDVSLSGMKYQPTWLGEYRKTITFLHAFRQVLKTDDGNRGSVLKLEDSQNKKNPRLVLKVEPVESLSD